jgi:nucleoside-diphosphate-sugar epimerase
MVLGNGLLANAFAAFKDDKDVFVFASGVSNSKENNPLEFDKEFNLLKDKIRENPDVKLIYFSTCSIFDNSISGSPYITHKIEMEKFIIQHSEKFLVFRLPNVVGQTSNPNTFFNFFKDKILSGDTLHIQEAATRYLIDVRDLSELLPLLIREQSFENKVINVCFNNRVLVSEIIRFYEDLLNVKANKVMIAGGSNYSIENDDFINFLNGKGIIEKANYNYLILQHYLSLTTASII